MSFFENQIVGIAGTLIGKMLTISPSRSFAGFSEFCSITEVHNAAVQATQYPIEDGTQGTDHIVRLPDVLQWEVVFEERSNPRQTYDRLRKLMRARYARAGRRRRGQQRPRGAPARAR